MEYLHRFRRSLLMKSGTSSSSGSESFLVGNYDRGNDDMKNNTDDNDDHVHDDNEGDDHSNDDESNDVDEYKILHFAVEISIFVLDSVLAQQLF